MPASCQISGNIGSDPEFRVSPSDKSIVSFSVAVQAGRDQDGVEQTVWCKVTCWNQLADHCYRVLKKGMHVLCGGYPKVYTYDRSDGSKGAAFELTAFSVQKRKVEDYISMEDLIREEDAKEAVGSGKRK